MRERPKATTGTAYVAGFAAQRPPAHRDHLQCGQQRKREGPKATTVPPLFQELQLRGLLRTVITFTVAISACEEGQSATTVPTMLQNIPAQRPPAHRDHLRRGHQRRRKGPRATTCAVYVSRNCRSEASCRTRSSTARPSAHARRATSPHSSCVTLQTLQLRGLLSIVITYNAAISACEKGQKPQQAMPLVQTLQLRGLRPTVSTYNATIRACARGLQPQYARQIVQEL